MQEPVSGGAESPPSAVDVRLHRIKHGTSATVWMLDDTYSGLMTHRDGEWGRYCPGERNGCTLHKKELFWKGYVAAMVWEPGCGAWLPRVLEITERLELDLRCRYARGQVWQLNRERELTKKKNPVRGKLLETRDLAETPAAFTVFDVLYAIYHRQDVILGIENPLPMPARVDIIKGAPPKGPESNGEASKPISQAEWHAMRAKLGFGARRPANGQS